LNRDFVRFVLQALQFPVLSGGKKTFDNSLGGIRDGNIRPSSSILTMFLKPFMVFQKKIDGKVR
jgi:hypothetical protein